MGGRSSRRIRIAAAILAVGLVAGACRAGEGIRLGARTLQLSQHGIEVELFEARAGLRTLYVVRATLPADTAFRVQAHAEPAPLAAIVGAGPLVAVNGGFYDTNGKPLGLVVEDGATKNPLLPKGGSGILVRDEAGLRVVHRDALPDPSRIDQALQSIDRIVDGGRSLVGRTADRAFDARSAVATYSDGSARLYAVFSPEAIESRECNASGCTFELNRRSTSSGVSLAELARFLVAEGAEAALNLDGGYSTSFEARLADRHLRVVAFRATINALVARP